MGKDPKNGGNHQTWSYPADKFIPKAETKSNHMYAGPFSANYRYSAEARRIIKKMHRKRCRAWSNDQVGIAQW